MTLGFLKLTVKMNHTFWGAPPGGYLVELPPDLGSTLPAPWLESAPSHMVAWSRFTLPSPSSHSPEVSSQNSSLPISPCFLVGGAKKPLTGATAHRPPLLQKYVQDVLQEQLAESVYRALKEQGGHIYVCGDVTMAADVLKAIQRIMTQQGKLSEEDAGVFISRLRVSDSWQPASKSFLSSNLYHLTLRLGLYLAMIKRERRTARHAGTHSQYSYRF